MTCSHYTKKECHDESNCSSGGKKNKCECEDKNKKQCTKKQCCAKKPCCDDDKKQEKECGDTCVCGKCQSPRRYVVNKATRCKSSSVSKLIGGSSSSSFGVFLIVIAIMIALFFLVRLFT